MYIIRARTESWILENSWNSPGNFPDLEKVWKIEVKSWKNGKRSWVFLKGTTSASQVKFFLCVGQILFNLAYTSWKKLCLCVFWSHTVHLFYNLESGKKIVVLEKAWKKSWILDKNSVHSWIHFFCIHIIVSVWFVCFLPPLQKRAHSKTSIVKMQISEKWR